MLVKALHRNEDNKVQNENFLLYNAKQYRHEIPQQAHPLHTQYALVKTLVA